MFSIANDAPDALSKSRKIVGHFKHSPANTAELEAQQAALGQKQEPLVHDVPTRWNMVDMVKRLNRNQAAIRATLDQQQHKFIMLTPPEWNKVQRLDSSRALSVGNPHINY